MVPFGACVGRLNNRPLAVSVPTGRYPPLLLDMTTSVAAPGKTLVARHGGVPKQEGWGLDLDGRVTTDSNALAPLLPISSPKGSGMALLFECFASVMAGNALTQPVLSSMNSDSTGEPRAQAPHADRAAVHNQNSVLAAINISRFVAVEDYKSHIDLLVDGVKLLPRANGFDEILMPGERQERS
jgi:ureidoglycolate dehydrogenase (NAD+)